MSAMIASVDLPVYVTGHARYRLHERCPDLGEAEIARQVLDAFACRRVEPAGYGAWEATNESGTIVYVVKPTETQFVVLTIVDRAAS